MNCTRYSVNATSFLIVDPVIIGEEGNLWMEVKLFFFFLDRRVVRQELTKAHMSCQLLSFSS